jgi:hypothetical protein
MLHDIISFKFFHNMKTNSYLIPLVGITGFAVSLVFAISVRNLLKNPDVIIDRRHNPRPWEKLIDEGI